MSDTSATAARSLFAREQHAVLCSAHAGCGGWPFGSIVPYAETAAGDALVFLSDIAEHTANLRAEARATLFVADGDARQRPQAGARLALLVHARLPTGPAAAAAEAVYFARFPQAASMRQAHGFEVWQLHVQRVRWIAGFGEMGWLTRAEWSGRPDPIAADAADIVAHLNADHADAVVAMAGRVVGTAPAACTVTGVDSEGLDVEAATADGRSHDLRLVFAEPATNAADVRTAVVAMVRQARAAAASRQGRA
jgi:putative heme iron utilization protein